MNPNKRFLTPKFLNRFDEWLLLNKPETWTARTHLVLYYVGGFIAILALLSFVFPDDPRTSSAVWNWILFTSIITIIALVVYLIYLLRFNVFKRYGSKTGGARLQTLLLYFFSIGIIITIPFVQGIVESAKANMAYADDDLVRDVNKINTSIVQLEYDSLDHRWSRDTIIVVDTLPGHSRMAPPSEAVTSPAEVVTDTVVTISAVPGTRRRTIDTAAFRIALASADSSEKISDSLWVFLTAPAYTFVSLNGARDFTSVHQLTSADIYRNTVKQFRRPDVGKTMSELQQLLEKYRTNYTGYAYYEYDYDIGYNPNYDHIKTIRDRYHIVDVDNSFRNIMQRKNMWRGHSIWAGFQAFFYITLSITLLLFVFRHSTVKAFFLSALAACILTILTALILAFGGYSAIGVFALMLFYFVVFAAISASAWMSKTRNVVTGIAINLSVVMLPFIPLIMVALYHAIQEERYRSMNSYYDSGHLQSWYCLAQIAGPVILLLLTATYIHRLYRRWYALPEE